MIDSQNIDVQYIDSKISTGKLWTEQITTNKRSTLMAQGPPRSSGGHLAAQGGPSQLRSGGPHAAQLRGPLVAQGAPSQLRGPPHVSGGPLAA